MAPIGVSSHPSGIVSLMCKAGVVAVFLGCLGLLLLDVSDMPAGAVPYDGSIGQLAGGSAGVELIVFEVPGCRYCVVFRRDVAPSYGSTSVGRVAPLRFVDLNDPVAEHFELVAPVTVVPTFVLARDGVEIDRIAGYAGRDSIHRLLASVISRE